MQFKLFEAPVISKNAGKYCVFSSSAQTKSDNRGKSLFWWMSQPATMLRGGSDDAIHRGLVSRRSYHLTANQFFSELASYDSAINVAWLCGNNRQ